MKAWPRPDVPRIAPDPRRPHVFDTASGGVVEVGPAASEAGGTARLYVCGITPYDATHLGHAMTYVTFDLLHRTWLDAGLDVVYTQNVTDVDDPLLERAEATDMNWEDLANEQTHLFRDDMTALRVIPPQHYYGVVETIPLVTGLIRRLIAAGSVYQLDDPEHPDWYFSCTGTAGFGTVSHLDRETALAVFGERGGDPDRPGKRDPLDCLVWKMGRVGEPCWPSPLGYGRPGWHVECTAIALKYLGPAFDVQGGGSDLAFPHHEMCAAQAWQATGEPLAHAFVHVGMVGYEGEKMSKSRGNLVLVSKLMRSGVDPMAIRLALLDHHYRADWEFADADIERATRRLASWRTVLNDSTAFPATETIAAVRTAMRDDLDAPAALAAVDAWVAASASVESDDTDAVDEVVGLVDALLGVRL